MTGLKLPNDYDAFLKGLKERIRAARLRASLAVNRELVMLYWGIGRDILARQREHGWGARIIDRLAADLRQEFPEVTGFSPRNLKYMRALAESWPDEPIVQQLAAQIPWFHNCAILDKVKNPSEREWYIRQTIQNGWSRNVLVHQIESGLYRRQGKALTNFTRTLPAPQSELDAKALAHLEELAVKVKNIAARQATETETNLPVESCDSIFMRFVYHHITKPTETDASLFRSLKPGGLLAVIDEEPRPGTTVADGVPKNRNGHGVPMTVLISELNAAGFDTVITCNDWPLHDVIQSYCIVFRKPYDENQKRRTRVELSCILLP